MTAFGAVLAVLVVLYVEGIEIEMHATAPGSSARQAKRDRSGINYQADGEVVNADPKRVVKKIERIRSDPHNYQNELPKLKLPAHGETYDDCGDDVLHVCTSCEETAEIGRTCYRAACPRCWQAWAKRATVRVGAKIEATRAYLYTVRGKSPKFHHLTFSPPDDFATNREDVLGAGIEIIKEACDTLGVDDGVIVYHPYRIAEEHRGDVLDHSSGEGELTWADVLRQIERDGFEAVRDQYLVFEPHFHVIAVAPFVPGGEYTSTFYEETGWVYKRITKGGDNSESNVSLYDEFDLARALSYTLSHAGQPEDNGDSYRYIGRTHNREAKEKHKNKIDAAVREVAPTTLGLSFGSTSCTRQLEDGERAAGGSPSPPSNPDPDHADDQDDDQGKHVCGGKMVPVEYVLNNPDKYPDLDVASLGKQTLWWWFETG